MGKPQFIVFEEYFSERLTNIYIWLTKIEVLIDRKHDGGIFTTSKYQNVIKYEMINAGYK